MRLHAREKTRPKNSGQTKTPVVMAARYVSIAAVSPLLLAAALTVALAILAISLAGAITDGLAYLWWGLADTIRWRRERERKDGRARDFCLAGIPETHKKWFTAQLLSVGAEMAWEAARADRASKERTAR